MREPIDFTRLAAALLDRIDTLVPMWLPGGKRNGAEWECADLSGGKGDSCKVNMHTGKWADFATDDRGGDLIGLYAAIHGVDQGKAAHKLMEELGWERRGDAPAFQPRPAPQPQPAKEPAKRSTWRAIVPVPESAPKPSLKHFQRGEPEAFWEYRVDGQLWGVVARYPTSDGGKDIVPWTWCIDEGDSRGLSKWHMKQWDDPRPLYCPRGALSADQVVLVVEGEKCALAAAHSLPDLDPISWPGGGKAWDKASWSWIYGRKVVLWPDCDAKREKLSTAERNAGVDQLTKPLLEEAKQPGVRTMMQLGAHLAANGCEVLICPLPKPGAVTDGWDIADAIAAGWTPEQLRAFLAAARPLAGEPTESPDTDQPHPAAGAGRKAKRDRTGWRDWLVLTDKGAIKACRENVVIALDGVPSQQIDGVSAAKGVIAFNEFSNNVVKLKPTPWGTPAGEWLEEDELEMGDWLVREHWLPSMPRTGLEEAVKMVAGRHRFHPVRAYLETVRGKWDGTKRLTTWLEIACRAETPNDIGEELNRKYLARVGSWLLMAMCARVTRPGSKFDYMAIFEGKQGWGKSTLAATLGGDWFADTGLVLGEKDAYQNLQGVWVYEIGELDSFSKAEVTKIKQFVSSPKDRFRASFDRRPRDYPRQVVFIGTTNEDHYLSDPTGNRRFWPIRVGGPVDIAWLREHRDQLFAEALEYLDRGYKFYPTTVEQAELFDPQQHARTVEVPIESRIVAYLYDEEQRVPHGGENGAYVNEITTSDLLSKIGIGLEKQVTAPNLIKQANAVLKKLGWKLGKTSAKGGAMRRNVFKRPPTGGQSQQAQVQGQQPERTTHDSMH